jgi:hypothetical protein
MSNTVADFFPAIKAQAGSAGVCDITDLMDRMNIIGPEILDRIEAKGTVTTWCLPICSSCIVLPSDLATPLQAWRSGLAMGFRGEYWLGRIGGDVPIDMSQEVPWAEVIDDGRYAYTQVHPLTVTQNDVYEFRARSQLDAGKTVQIRYADDNGREVILETVLAGDFKGSTPSSKTGIGPVTRVCKPRTVGAIELWVRNLYNGNRLLAAVYDAHDELPSYRIVHLTGYNGGGSFAIKGKKKWSQLRAETDLVPFGRIAVWRAAMAAEAASANKNFEAFNALIGEAVGLLDAELTGLRPKGQAEVVDYVTPFTVFNQRPLARRYF